MKFEIGWILLVFISKVSSLSCKNAAGVKQVTKMIIDTDGASDDGLALGMALLAQKRDNGPEILAITCVNGVTRLSDATMNVLKVLKTMNRTDIPVYAGAPSPLLGPANRDLSHGYDGFGDFEYPDPPSRDMIKKTHAVNVLIESVKNDPGEVTIFAMAPLTNIALAIKMCPSFLKWVKQIIVMGGSVEGRGNAKPGIDGNSLMDPVANRIVFESAGSCPIIFVYLETTLRAQPTMEFRKTLNHYDTSASWLLRNSERKLLNYDDKYWFCPDAVAMAVALTSGCIVTRSSVHYLEAIYCGEETAGMTIVDYQNSTNCTPNTNLIQDINQKEFEQLLVRYVSG